MDVKKGGNYRSKVGLGVPTINNYGQHGTYVSPTTNCNKNLSSLDTSFIKIV
jgi:hypothetical protein